VAIEDLGDELTIVHTRGRQEDRYLDRSCRPEPF
jgi:hypothetical protein